MHESSAKKGRCITPWYIADDPIRKNSPSRIDNEDGEEYAESCLVSLVDLSPVWGGVICFDVKSKSFFFLFLF